MKKILEENTVEGVLEAFVELEVKDKDGKLLEARRFRSESFVANILRFLRQLWIGSPVYSENPGTHYQQYSAAEVVDITGAAIYIYQGEFTGSSAYEIKAASADVTKGIGVGTGTGAVSAAQYALGGVIGEGAGSGQLSHGACSLDTLVINGNVATLKIIRTFTNNSGDAITVYELGLFSSIRAYNNVNKTVMFIRDLIAGGVSVPNGSTLTLRYILTTTA